MLYPPKGVEMKQGATGSVAVAIDKDKGSQSALKWATDSLLTKGQSVTLIHVRLKTSVRPSPSLSPRMYRLPTSCDLEKDQNIKELFIPFRCFCRRKDIECNDVILEDTDVAKAILEFVTQAGVENLVIGGPSKDDTHRRFKTTDIPGNITKGAPEFCNVYVVSQGKVSTMHSASIPTQSGTGIHSHPQIPSMKQDSHQIYHSTLSSKGPERASLESGSQESSLVAAHDSERQSWTSQSYVKDDVEAEMRRLKLELKQTMEMYNTACREALSAKQKLQEWKMEEQKRLEEMTRLAEQAALAIAVREKAKAMAALEHAEASQRIAELKTMKETEEKKKVLDALAQIQKVITNITNDHRNTIY